MKHAREVFDMALPTPQVELTGGGVDVALEALERMPVKIECASEGPGALKGPRHTPNPR